MTGFWMRFLAGPAFRSPAFWGLLLSNNCSRLASSALAVLLGYQVFAITGDPLDLGWLGLAEALPAIALLMYGGHVADRHPRRLILLSTAALFTAMAAAASVAAILFPGQVAPLFAVAFAGGVVRAFDDPAAAGLEALVVPAADLVRGLAAMTTSARLAGVLGPALGGLAWGWIGPAATYGAIAALFAASLACLLLVPDAVQPPVARDTEGTWSRMADGVRYVWHDQLLLGSMALDLFAVFFGGATALLPAVATDVLHVGPGQFGILRGATAAGSLVAAAFAARLLPQRQAGRALLWVIAGFGVATVAFGLSRVFWLSAAALFVAGLCDGMSVVIRRAILRLCSPDAMRGRIAAVKSVFVGSSNELGAFESGLAAAALGVPAAIWTGGVVTLAVVAGTALLAPRLRRLDLRAMAAEQAGP